MFFCQRRVQRAQAGACPHRDDEFDGVVRDDAAMGGDAEFRAFHRTTIKGSGIAPHDAQRSTVVVGAANLFAQLVGNVSVGSVYR